MRTFVIGDPHGAGEEVQALLEQEKVVPGKDRVVFVGDLFDRGRHSHVIWDIIKRYNAVSTRGNHEEKFCKFLAGKRSIVGMPPHYIWAINNLIEHGVSMDEFSAFINGLPLLVEIAPGVIVTHGGVRVDNPYQEDMGANVYANFLPDGAMPRPVPGDGIVYWWDHYKGDPLVLYGHLVSHTGVPRIKFSPKGQVNAIGLDTATVHGGFCTAYCVENQSIHQYISGINYFEPLKQEFKKHPPQLRAEVVEWLMQHGTGYEQRKK